MKSLLFIKKNALILLAIALFLGLTTACGGKGKVVEAANTAANLPVSAKTDTLTQIDISKFDFNAYLNKQHYDSLDIGKSIIIVHPNAAFFAFYISKGAVIKDLFGDNELAGDSFRVFQFIKQNSQWEKIEDKVIPIGECSCVAENLMLYEDMNGDGIQDILLTVSRIARNKYHACYLQSLDKQSFIRVDSFEKLPNPLFDTSTMQLTTNKRVSNHSGTSKMYIWKNNSFVFQKGVVYTFNNHEEKEVPFTDENHNE